MVPCQHDTVKPDDNIDTAFLDFSDEWQTYHLQNDSIIPPMILNNQFWSLLIWKSSFNSYFTVLLFLTELSQYVLCDVTMQLVMWHAL